MTWPDSPRLPRLARAVRTGVAIPVLFASSGRVAIAQRADTTATRTVAPGVTHIRTVHNAGPWIVHVVRVDLRRRDLRVRQRRANDSLYSRERVSAMAGRAAQPDESVLVAINGDFFDLRTGANENNLLIDGEWWKGVRVTESPFDTFDNVHSQFALDSARRPLIDRFAFDGWLSAGSRLLPILTLNANPSGVPEGTALYTRRFGANTPRDTTRATSEVTLLAAGRRADTLLYVRQGASSPVSGGAIPIEGAILAGYGARAAEVAALPDGDTVRITMNVIPRRLPRKGAAPLTLMIGGWPRILRDGENVARRAASEEGTISRNAEARHPRSAVGFSRDSTTLFLVTVDGRSAKSVGMTTGELADLLRALGVWNALNFDGGGSTTMVVDGAIVNTPADPTGERPVGNALLVLRKIPR